MTALRETPGQVSETNRHRRPWAEGSRTKLVPLVDPHVDGQWFIGHFRVPARLARAEGRRHTNAELEFQKICEKAVERWRLWRQMRGWQMNTKPKITGPFDVPKATETAEGDEDFRIYTIQARFGRMYPAYLKLEDHLQNIELAKRYGVDLEADRLPWNPDGKGDSGWVDPMKHAEERRQRLGIKRKDYQFDPDLSKPLGMVDVPGSKELLRKAGLKP